MGHYPPRLMRLLYTGLVGNGDEQNAEYMAKVFGDGGLQLQAIQILLYVQMAVDLEWPSNDLRLPENFPDGWDGSSAVDSDLAEDESTMLSLSTSVVQSDVSEAFDRIGFEHTEEHIITMDELVRDYGIHLSLKPDYEILSIDLADVPNKIGIEVDGPGHFCTVLDTWSPQEESRGRAITKDGKRYYSFDWDDRQAMNGSTALKNRLLQRLGWKMLNVPFYEWDDCKGDVTEEDDYCEKLLDEL